MNLLKKVNINASIDELPAIHKTAFKAVASELKTNCIKTRKVNTIQSIKSRILAG
jgi:hypothetical protein